MILFKLSPGHTNGKHESNSVKKSINIIILQLFN